MSKDENFHHRHNVVDKKRIGAEKKFGIKVTLPKGDTFATILGEKWETIHWYATEAERDAAFENMAERHGYYRHTDNPTQVLEKIVR